MKVAQVRDGGPCGPWDRSCERARRNVPPRSCRRNVPPRSCLSRNLRHPLKTLLPYCTLRSAQREEPVPAYSAGRTSRSTSSAATAVWRRMLLSQILTTRHPRMASWAFTSPSRSTLRAILLRHLSGSRCAANCASNDSKPRSRQPRPCQKSPSTNTATRERGNTISGSPGKALAALRHETW